MLKYYFNRVVDDKGNLIIPNPNLKLFEGGIMYEHGIKQILQKTLIAN